MYRTTAPPTQQDKKGKNPPQPSKNIDDTHSADRREADYADVPATPEPSDAVPFHNVASIYPLMSNREYDALVESIATNGLHEPIWRYKGQIIDGRNRYRACRQLSIEPEYREWDGRGSLVSFVVAANTHRRDLSVSQKAMVAARAKRVYAEEAAEPHPIAGIPSTRPGTNSSPAGKGRLRDQFAKLFGVSAGAIQDATYVLNNGIPALVEAVSRGALKVSAAALIGELPSEEQAAIVEQAPKAIRERAAEIRRHKKATAAKAATQVKKAVADLVLVTASADDDAVNETKPTTVKAGEQRVDDTARVNVKPAKQKVSVAAPTPEVDAALEADDLDDASETAESGESSSNDHSESAPGEEPLDATDEEWLASLPLHSLLENAAQFDFEALLWRDAQPGLNLIRQIFRPTDEDNRHAKYGVQPRVRFDLQVAVLIGQNHPKHWILCDRCGGNEKDRNPCAGCKGHGFIITHVGCIG